MLATFGLDRLEAGLDDDTVSPADVTAVLEQAKADCAKPARAQHVPPRPTNCSTTATTTVCRDTRSHRFGTAFADARLSSTTESNPEFQPTRQADRV